MFEEAGGPKDDHVSAVISSRNVSLRLSYNLDNFVGTCFRLCKHFECDGRFERVDSMLYLDLWYE